MFAGWSEPVRQRWFLRSMPRGRSGSEFDAIELWTAPRHGIFITGL